MVENVLAVAVIPLPSRNPVYQALEWIQFGTETNRNRTPNEGGLDVSENFFSITESNIEDIASVFDKRAVAQWRVNFGMRHVKYAGITNADAHKALWGTALDSAALRKVEVDQAYTISKAAGPGKFKDDRMWPEGQVEFENYLSTIYGVNRLLLSYVVRSQTAPDHTTNLQGNFIEDTIACAPLNGAQLQSTQGKSISCSRTTL